MPNDFLDPSAVARENSAGTAPAMAGTAPPPPAAEDDEPTSRPAGEPFATFISTDGKPVQLVPANDGSLCLTVTNNRGQLRTYTLDRFQAAAFRLAAQSLPEGGR